MVVHFVNALVAQAPATYWVRFTDKSATPYSIDQPEAFLSERAIQRRAAQGITLDEQDLPVDPNYIATVLAQGDVTLVNRSKWFNAITIRTEDPLALAAVQGLPFVVAVENTRSLQGSGPGEEHLAPPVDHGERGGDITDYGPSFLQIAMMNGHVLHGMEAKGQGLLIGVLDSGFDRVDELPAFEALRAREGIIHTRDMVVHDGDVFADHWHGRSVLSTMVGQLEGLLKGTAPEADYVLLRTEDADSEFLVEEDNWVAGAELCDSLGCDVLNTSLGYTVFDDSLQDHTYADMNGQVTRISIAADIAARKGMIPVISAGNSGESEWHYIGAPADAVDILAVGAVGDVGNSAPFSSYGPSADGRVKPDVAAMGWGAIGLRFEGDSIAPLNGTSFAAPILAGLVACLWQLHPDRTAQDIMDAVRRSASQFDTPDDRLGYGIPDLLAAHDHLVMTTTVHEAHEHVGVTLFPVPFTDRLTVVGAEGQEMNIALCDPIGRVVLSRTMKAVGGPIELHGLGDLPEGAYLLHVVADGIRTTRSVIKAR
ncbi:MAG: S8 family serine peptidase [Flavobacteriales bacterium]